MVPHVVDKPMTIQAAQRQINAILAGCTTASSIKEFTNQAKRKQDEFFLPKKAAHTSTAKPPPPTYMNDNHDAFLYHHWNNKNKINNGTNKPTTAP